MRLWATRLKELCTSLRIRTAPWQFTRRIRFRKWPRIFSAASPAGPDVRDFSRLFYARAQPAEIDDQGRIRIPAELVALASLQREAVLLGVQDHMELWDKQHWDDYLAKRQERFDQIAEGAFTVRGQDI